MGKKLAYTLLISLRIRLPSAPSSAYGSYSKRLVFLVVKKPVASESEAPFSARMHDVSKWDFLFSKRAQCMSNWVAAFSVIIGFMIALDYQDMGLSKQC